MTARQEQQPWNSDERSLRNDEGLLLEDPVAPKQFSVDQPDFHRTTEELNSDAGIVEKRDGQGVQEAEESGSQVPNEVIEKYGLGEWDKTQTQDQDPKKHFFNFEKGELFEGGVSKTKEIRENFKEWAGIHEEFIVMALRGQEEKQINAYSENNLLHVTLTWVKLDGRVMYETWTRDLTEQEKTEQQKKEISLDIDDEVGSFDPPVIGISSEKKLEVSPLAIIPVPPPEVYVVGMVDEGGMSEPAVSWVDRLQTLFKEAQKAPSVTNENSAEGQFSFFAPIEPARIEQKGAASLEATAPIFSRDGISVSLKPREKIERKKEEGDTGEVKDEESLGEQGESVLKQQENDPRGGIESTRIASNKSDALETGIVLVLNSDAKEDDAGTTVEAASELRNDSVIDQRAPLEMVRPINTSSEETGITLSLVEDDSDEHVDLVEVVSVLKNERVVFDDSKKGEVLPEEKKEKEQIDVEYPADEVGITINADLEREKRNTENVYGTSQSEDAPSIFVAQMQEKVQDQLSVEDGDEDQELSDEAMFTRETVTVIEPAIVIEVADEVSKDTGISLEIQKPDAVLVDTKDDVEIKQYVRESRGEQGILKLTEPVGISLVEHEVKPVSLETPIVVREDTTGKEAPALIIPNYDRRVVGREVSNLVRDVASTPVEKVAKIRRAEESPIKSQQSISKENTVDTARIVTPEAATKAVSSTEKRVPVSLGERTVSASQDIKPEVRVVEKRDVPIQLVQKEAPQVRQISVRAEPAKQPVPTLRSKMRQSEPPLVKPVREQQMQGVKEVIARETIRDAFRAVTTPKARIVLRPRAIARETNDSERRYEGVRSEHIVKQALSAIAKKPAVRLVPNSSERLGHASPHDQSQIDLDAKGNTGDTRVPYRVRQAPLRALAA